MRAIKLTLSFGLLSIGAILLAQTFTPAENADPDLPAFMAGRVDKIDYLQRRAEWVNRRRGIERGRPFDPSARGRALRELNRQEGIPDNSTSTLSSGSKILTPTPAVLNASTWTSIGPSPLPNGQTFNTNNVSVSGRTVAIAIHPTNGNIAYVGAAQGGVYRTTDGGATWTALFDNAQTLSIGAIAIAPSQPSTIYIGTGEGNFSGDCFFGVGIYRIDNADSASPTLTGPLNKDASNNDVLSGWGIDKIIVHPTDPNTIFFGTTSGIGGIAGVSLNDTTAASTKPRALWRSTNAAGANPTFQKLTAATDNGGNLSVTDVEFEPGNPNNVLACVRGSSTAGGGGVYRSTNALAATPTFTRTLAVATAAPTLARAEIAITKIGSTVYVFAALADSSGTLKRSTDGGQTWSAAIGTTGFCDGQCDYDIPIAVDPTDANILYLGGAGDSGSAHILTKVTNATATPTFTAMQTGLHADEHAIEIDPSNHNIIWTGNDGGLWKSTDAAATWTSLNNAGYTATQFQSLAVHPTDANFTIGGTQDNGTECQGPCGTFTGNTWNQADYGDGGFALIDQTATNLTSVNMYHTYYNQTNTLIGYAYVTSTANAKFVSSPTSNSWSFNGTGGVQSCANGGGYLCSEAVEFYMPMAVGPGSPNPVYSGTDRLHRAATVGDTNAVVSQAPIVSGVPISAIGISPQSDNVRIVGLENGQVWRTTTGSSTLNNVTGTVPSMYVARAVIDPNNSNTAYVTLSGYFGNSTSHIYKTTNLSNATPTWTGIDGGQIPDVPVNAFVVDPSDSTKLYAGTDIGVYRSVDSGTTWTAYSNGLPRVAVFDMAIQNPNRILRIATHGRGMWEIFIGATGTLQGTITNASTSSAINGATVTAGSNTTTTNASGFYQFSSLSVGTYSVTASAPGYNNNTVSGVNVTDGGTTTQNIALTPAATSGCKVDTSQADFQAGTANNVDLTTSPNNVILAVGAGTLDQQNTSVGGTGNAITTTTWEAQTFIPSVAGQITQIDADLFCSGCSGTNPNITIEIRTTSSGVPTGTILATTTIPGFSSGTGTFYSATFTTPATLASGTTYAVVARLLADRTTGSYAWLRSNSSQYSNGARVVSTNSGSSWAVDNTDFGFKTYMSTGFASSGDLTSSVKDANPLSTSIANWTTLSWTNPALPSGTTLQFQAAGSNSSSGPFNFVGPNGTASTFYTTSGGSLAQFNGFRYLKYKAYLATTNSANTPTLNDVTVCFNNSVALSTNANLSSLVLSSGTLSPTFASGTTVYTASVSNATSSITVTPTVADATATVQVRVNGGSFASVTSGSPSGSLALTNVYPSTNTVDVKVTAQDGVTIKTYTVTVTRRATQTINFPAIPTKTYGGAAFNPGASASSGLTVSYSSSNTSVATVSGSTLTIVGAGQSTITASQGGDNNYDPATSVQQTLTVNPESINVTADNKTKIKGTADPTLTYTSDPLVGSDTFSGSLTRAAGEGAGIYAITQGTLTAGSNYTINFTGANLIIRGPIAQADATTKPSDSSQIKIALSTLLSNDTRIDINGATQTDSLSITGVTNGPTCTVSISGASVLFTPDGTSNSDTFTYTLLDSVSGANDTGTVTVTTNATPFTLQIVDKQGPTFNGTNTSLTVDFVGVPNQSYTIDYSIDLNTWTSYPGNPVSTGATGSFAITLTASGDQTGAWSSMFFRATR